MKVSPLFDGDANFYSFLTFILREWTASVLAIDLTESVAKYGFIWKELLTESALSFSPRFSTHAITEVVFGVTFRSPLAASALGKAEGSHGLWRTELPSFIKGMGFQFAVGQGGFTSAPTAIPALEFQYVNPDGTPRTRMRIDEFAIVVNVFNYSRWAETWPVAKKLLLHALAAVTMDQPVKIATAVLQVVDQFDWKEDLTGYKIEQLLDFTKGMVPRSISNRGPQWHFHQGWFVESSLPVHIEKLLERTNVDGLLDASSRAVVRVDASHNAFLSTDIDSVNISNVVSDIFQFLHEANKRLVGNLMDAHMLESIGLVPNV